LLQNQIKPTQQHRSFVISGKPMKLKLKSINFGQNLQKSSQLKLKVAVPKHIASFDP
jgi:hypothetical protein